mgnify:CR=1 FL=1
MTRKSKREIERALDDIGAPETFDVQALLWADLKDYHGGHLSPGERRLLDEPEVHLTPSARGRVQTPAEPTEDGVSTGVDDL